jgi:hypothetical protein
LTKEQELRDEVVSTRPRKRAVTVRVTGAVGMAVRVRTAVSVTRMLLH